MVIMKVNVKMDFLMDWVSILTPMDKYLKAILWQGRDKE